MREELCSDRGSTTDSGIIVQDARRLRQHLATKLLLNQGAPGAESDARTKFIAGLEDAINEVDILRHMLFPVVKEVTHTPLI